MMLDFENNDFKMDFANLLASIEGMRRQCGRANKFAYKYWLRAGSPTPTYVFLCRMEAFLAKNIKRLCQEKCK